MTLPLIYLALAPTLAHDLGLDTQLARLGGAARIERWAGPGNPSPEAVADALLRAEVLVTGWGTPSLAALAAWSPHEFAVRLVAHTAGTVKQLVPLEALQRGLLVTTSNEALADAVAEFTLGAMLLARRQAFLAARALRDGRPTPSHTTMHELRGSIVGVIGASAIGQRVLRLLEPFGVTALLVDPYCPPELAHTLGATLVGLETLLQQSDIVSLHAPLTPTTRGMLGPHELAQIKDGALLLNTARGGLIDADALLAELQRGRISALLDVTDPHEPLPPDSPFFALDNCVVLPHIAGMSAEAFLQQGRYAVDEIERFLSNAGAARPVLSERWASIA